MNDGALLLIFVAECLMYLTAWGNNTFVDFLLLGGFYLDTKAIWLMWVFKLSYVPLPLWIIYYMKISIRVNYLHNFEEKEWNASTNRSTLNDKEVFVSGIKVDRPYKRRRM